MTSEEIINEIKSILSELDNGEDAVSYLTQNDVKWLNENIKALEHSCKDCISRAETVQFLENHSKDFEDVKVRMAFLAASSLVNNPQNLPPVTPKTECSCEQIKWERDMAIAQLNELGYGLGEKPRTGNMVEPQESEAKIT